MLRDIKKNKLFFWLVTSILFFSFAFNIFGAVSLEDFKSNYKDSEALVSNQIICQSSLFAGQLIAQKTDDNQGSSGLVDNCDASKLVPYSSHFGIQGKFLSIGYTAVETVFQSFSPKVFIALSQFLTALASAVLFTIFALWVKKKYGLYVAIFTVAGIAIAPMLVGFGRNLYWALPLMIAPFVYSLYYYRVGQPTKATVVFWSVIGVLLYLRYLAGYEYITTLTLMVFAAMAYVLYLNKAKLKAYAKTAALTIGVSLIALIAAMGTHIGALTVYTGSVNASVQKIAQRAEERTVTGDKYTAYPYMNLKSIAPAFYEATDGYANYEKRAESGSLAAAILVNTATYLLIPVIHIPVKFSEPFGLYIQSTAVFLIILGALFVTRKMWMTKKQIRETEALYVGLVLGLAGYLSWLIFGFSHSLVHAHINGILLYLPSALFGFIILGLFTQWGWGKFKKTLK